MSEPNDKGNLKKIVDTLEYPEIKFNIIIVYTVQALILLTELEILLYNISNWSNFSFDCVNINCLIWDTINVSSLELFKQTDDEDEEADKKLKATLHKLEASAETMKTITKNPINFEF